MHRILLIEDDSDLRRTLRAALEVEGFLVKTASSAADGTAQLRQSIKEASIDVVLLDLGLPDNDGSTVLTEARHHTNLPVIIISAMHEEARRIQLLDAGADDYLTKPFSIPELFARIRVALRHRGTMVSAAKVKYSHGNVMVDLEARQVSRAGAEIKLTPTEWNLLSRLVRQAGRVITHRQLLADIWGPEYVEHTHYLRLYMSQLRAKLEEDPALPVMLLSDTGVGYRLAESR